MASIEEALARVLADGNSPQAKTASAPASAKPEEIDVATFVEDIGKTAELLEKAAEALPTPPALMAQQLAMLENPMSVSKRALHDAHKVFAGQVLPQATASEDVPATLEEIQPTVKVASAEPSFLLSRIRR